MFPPCPAQHQTVTTILNNEEEVVAATSYVAPIQYQVWCSCNPIWQRKKLRHGEVVVTQAVSGTASL